MRVSSNTSPARKYCHFSSSREKLEDSTKMSEIVFRILMVTKHYEMQEKRDIERQEMKKPFHDIKEVLDTIKKHKMEM